MVKLTISLNNRQLFLLGTESGGWDFSYYCTEVLNRDPADVLRHLADEYEKKEEELNPYENMSFNVTLPSVGRSVYTNKTKVET